MAREGGIFGYPPIGGQMNYQCFACEHLLTPAPVEGWYRCNECNIEYSKIILPGSDNPTPPASGGPKLRLVPTEPTQHGAGHVLIGNFHPKSGQGR